MEVERVFETDRGALEGSLASCKKIVGQCLPVTVVGWAASIPCVWYMNTIDPKGTFQLSAQYLCVPLYVGLILLLPMLTLLLPGRAKFSPARLRVGDASINNSNVGRFEIVTKRESEWVHFRVMKNGHRLPYAQVTLSKADSAELEKLIGLHFPDLRMRQLPGDSSGERQ